MARLERPTAAADPSSGGRTIARLWRDAVAAGRSTPPYLVEEEPGRWREVSWPEAASRVDELAAGLLDLGVRKGDAVGILARTSLEWALFDFALALTGGVTAPVYASSSPRDAAYVLGHAEAVAVLVEDDAQREKVERERPSLPRLEHVLSFADLDALAERGRAYAAANPGAVAAATDAIDEDDLFTFIYTSGTTGPPKGCMIRHRNYYAMAEAIDRVGEFAGEGDLLLLYLPLAHNFGRLNHLAGPFGGYTLAFLPDPLRIGEALPAVRPTIFPSVPRVYEKIHAGIVARFEEETGLRRRLIDWALATGRRASAYRLAGEPLPPGLAVRHRLADRLVYSKVKERLGGRLRVAFSGGAPLAPEIAELFAALDILVLEGYGLTECTTAATCNRPSRLRFGTVGPPLPGVEVRLAEDGELEIRSETIFAGYYKDEAATREVLTADGWLRTGDVAEIDADGFVAITDRKKDLIVTAGGKNVAPQNLENELKSSQYVSQALVVGDRRPYLVALVTLDAAEIGKWAAARGLPTELETLAASPEARALVQGIVDEVNRERSGFEQVKRFAILPRDFSAEEGEVTPTLKLRRRTCQEHFAAELEALYAPSPGET